jgi:hypothetical protein
MISLSIPDCSADVNARRTSEEIQTVKKKILIPIVATLVLLSVGLVALSPAEHTPAATQAAAPQPQLNLAHYFPADGVIFIQWRDFLGQINAWQNSGLHSRYFASQSFKLWQRRHLALKLSQRLAEFEASLGRKLTLANVPASAGHEAALALYDIGGTQFVFITELATTTALASSMLASPHFSAKSFHDQNYFVAKSGGSIQVCYALLGMRLVVASKEALLLETLKSIRGDNANLAARPEFQQLVQEAPAWHDITLWLDLARLNQDWYFRHYWIHKNFAAIEPLRSGLIDLEMTDARWTEQRYFRLAENRPLVSVIPAATIKRIAAAVPAGVAAFQIDALSRSDPSLLALIDDLLFQHGPTRKEPPPEAVQSDNAYEGDYYDYQYDSDYYLPDNQDEFAADNYYLYTDWGDDSRYYRNSDSIFRREIDDPLLSGAAALEQYRWWQKSDTSRQQEIFTAIGHALDQANPVAVARFSEPNLEKNDLFLNFDHAMIMTLAAPAALDRRAFEQALEQAVRFNLVTSATPAAFAWQSSTVSGVDIRSLVFPLLGRGVAYALKGDILLLTNRSGYAEQVLRQSSSAPSLRHEQLSRYRLVRPPLGRQAFLKLFGQLDRLDEEPFFSGNIGSLFEVGRDVREVAFESEFRGGLWQEMVQYYLDVHR